MLKVIGAGVLLMATLIVFAGISRSDPEDVTTDTSFPLPAPTQDPLTPATPGTPARHQPFTPYASGPPSETWSYQDLSAAEQETVDLGRDVSGWRTSQDAMVEAVKAEARRQAAVIAQRAIGLADLGETGVVP